MEETKGERYLPDDMSSLTPSEVSIDDIEIEEETEEEVIERPQYTEEELDTLANYIMRMVTLFNMKQEDFSLNVINQIKNWLVEVTEIILLIFYDGPILHACLAYPLSPVSDLCYFIRPLNFIFTVDNYHDEVIFGSLTGDVEGSMLNILETFYAPSFAETKDWVEHIKRNTQSEIHIFLSYLTDLYYKMSGLTKLYIPYESSKRVVEECAKDKWLVKRLESIVVFWTQKIRLCLSDMDQLIPHEIHCPADEYNFWVYKYEVLSSLALQFNTKDFRHIVAILDKVQSLFIAHLKELMEEVMDRLEKTKDNYLRLQLLLEPCKTMESLNSGSALSDFADCIADIMHLLHVIWFNSKYYCKLQNVEKLLKYLSNQVIMCCTSKIDLAKILTNQPKTGIKVCDIFITWCLIYKCTLKKLFDFYETSTEEGWVSVNENVIFNQIDAFIQRLQDIIEICEAVIAFGRHDEDQIMLVRPKFTCNNSIELESMFTQIEALFNDGMNKIYLAIDMILNLHEKTWHVVKTNFKQLIKNIEEIVENSITSVFVNVANIEEMFQAMTAIIKFATNQRINETYQGKVAEMWKLLHAEIMLTSKFQAGAKNEKHAICGLYSEKIVSLQIRYDRLQRILNKLIEAKYLPLIMVSGMTCQDFDMNLKISQKAIKHWSDDWIGDWSNQQRFTNTLMCTSITFPGLIECNMDENLYLLLQDSKLLENLGVLPAAYTTKYKSMKIAYKSVVKNVLDHNLISSSLSIKEMILFRNLLTAVERKMSAGINKFTWAEEINDTYITECIKSLKELNFFLNSYKKICDEIVKICERICSTNVLHLQSTVPLELVLVKDRLIDSSESSRMEIFKLFQVIVGYTLNMFERFSQRSSKVSKAWLEFVQRIDSLLQESIFICIKSSLEKFTYLLTGSGSFRSEPIINFTVRSVDNKIKIEPPLEHLVQFLQSLLVHLSKLFFLDISVSRQYDRETPQLSKTQLIENEINQKIVQAIAKTRVELEKYLLLWRPNKIYRDVMQEVTGGSI